MAKGPKRLRRPTDAISNAAKAEKIPTGKDEKKFEPYDDKDARRQK